MTGVGQFRWPVYPNVRLMQEAFHFCYVFTPQTIVSSPETRFAVAVLETHFIVAFPQSRFDVAIP